MLLCRCPRKTCLEVNICLWGPALFELAQYLCGYAQKKQIALSQGRHSSLHHKCLQPSASYSLTEILRTRNNILEYKLDHVTSALKTFLWYPSHLWLVSNSLSGPQDSVIRPLTMSVSHFLPHSAHSRHTSLLTIPQIHKAGSNLRILATVAVFAWTDFFFFF